MLYTLGDLRVKLTGEGHFIADSADVIGDVTLGNQVSVWFNAVIRGDIAPIRIGDESNIQDGCVLHVDYNTPLEVGKRVTVGHQVTLHGCQIGDHALVGMNCVILNRAQIGKNCLVGAGSLVTEGKIFSEGRLILGSPARDIRALTATEIDKMHQNTLNYVKNRAHYITGLQAGSR